MTWRPPSTARDGIEYLVTVRLFSGEVVTKLGQRFRAGWACTGCLPGAEVLAIDDKPAPYQPRGMR